MRDALRRGVEPGIIGIAAPGERDGDARAGRDVELAHLILDRSGDRLRVDGAGEIEADRHDGHVVDRQHGRVREEDRLAAHLNGELRGADDGRADAIAGIGDGQRAARGELRSDLVGERFGDVSELGRLCPEKIFRHAAGEGDERGLRLARERFGELKRVAEFVEG